MTYIARTLIPKNQILTYSLTNIYGIGRSQSKIITKKGGFGLDSRGKDITMEKALEINELIKSESIIYGKDLVRKQNERILTLRKISSYRGFRHRFGLPVRGQRTHSNASRRKKYKFK